MIEQMREDSRLVAATCADFQHRLPGLRLQQLRHERDDIGLRNRLSQTDGQCDVFVSAISHRLNHKSLTRHVVQNSAQNPAVINATGAKLHAKGQLGLSQGTGREMTVFPHVVSVIVVMVRAVPGRSLRCAPGKQPTKPARQAP